MDLKSARTSGATCVDFYSGSFGDEGGFSGRGGGTQVIGLSPQDEFIRLMYFYVEIEGTMSWDHIKAIAFSEELLNPLTMNTDPSEKVRGCRNRLAQALMRINKKEWVQIRSAAKEMLVNRAIQAELSAEVSRKTVYEFKPVVIQRIYVDSSGTSAPVVFSHEGEHLVMIGSRASKIVVVKPASGKIKYEIQTNGPVSSTPFLHTMKDGRTIVMVGTETGFFQVFDPYNGEQLFELPLGVEIQSSPYAGRLNEEKGYCCNWISKFKNFYH